MITTRTTLRGSFVDLRIIYHLAFDFQSLYPCPYLDNLGEPLDDRWYDWCCEHWGTPPPDNIDVDYTENDDDCIMIVSFSTVMKPTGFFANLQQRFPKLQIQIE